MAHARDLYKTKLCTLFLKGNCPRQSCSFAHGDAELRRFPGTGGFSGRHGGGDFRDRSDRHTSPYRRHSPGRDGRGARQGNVSGRRFSPRDRDRSRSRSLVRRSRSYSSASERSRSKKQRGDGADAHLSDVSLEDIDKNHEVNTKKSSAVSPPGALREELQEKLNRARHEIANLTENKESLEKMLETSWDDTSKLTAKILDTENKLSNLQDDCKRQASKLKKMIKTYLKFNRFQEEVKKTQLKLQKMAEEVPPGDKYHFASHAEDSDNLNLSDPDIERSINGVTAEGLSGLVIPKTEDSVKKRRLHAVQALKNMQQNGGIVKIPYESDLNLSGSTQTLRPTGSAATDNTSKLDTILSADAGPTGDLRLGGFAPSSPADKVRGRDTKMIFSSALLGHPRGAQADTQLEEDRSTDLHATKERVALNLNMPPGKAYQNESEYFGMGHLHQLSKLRDGGQDYDADFGLQVKSEPHLALGVKLVES